jgi:hypothetical protein
VLKGSAGGQSAALLAVLAGLVIVAAIKSGNASPAARIKSP